MASVTGIVDMSPHCSMVATIGRNLSGTAANSFSTIVFSSTTAPRVRISPTIVVSFCENSIMVSESPMYILSYCLFNTCTRAFLTRSSPTCISLSASHASLAVSFSVMAIITVAPWSLSSSTTPMPSIAPHNPNKRKRIFIFTAHRP
ncbi:hypothetical protein IHE45_07G062300 [Dioscorea alata]|uniref:Uncharacterized protein n=1 Tax=Dioscorea alata TaxID=55571 RepID=A0ACB7VRX2_DIOAL|nr:hypothetical protein IHE45_07G062300 [Dioscorea alata]